MPVALEKGGKGACDPAHFPERAAEPPHFQTSDVTYVTEASGHVT